MSGRCTLRPTAGDSTVLHRREEHPRLVLEPDAVVDDVGALERGEDARPHRSVDLHRPSCSTQIEAHSVGDARTFLYSSMYSNLSLITCPRRNGVALLVIRIVFTAQERHSSAAKERECARCGPVATARPSIAS